MQHQSSLDAKVLNSQLNKALNSRIIIEQAKGMISQATSCDVDEAFNRLRTHARNHNEGLTALAGSIGRGSRSCAGLGRYRAHDVVTFAHRSSL